MRQLKKMDPPGFVDGGRFAFTVVPYKVFTHDGHGVEGLKGIEVPPASPLSAAAKTFVTHAKFREVIQYHFKFHGIQYYKMFGFWYDLEILEMEEVDIGYAYPGLRITCEVASVEENARMTYLDLRSVKLPLLSRLLYRLWPKQRSKRNDMSQREKRRKMLETKISLASWGALRSHVEAMMRMLDEDVDVEDCTIRYVLCESADFEILPDSRAARARTTRLLNAAARNWKAILNDPYDPRGRRFLLRMFGELVKETEDRREGMKHGA